MIYEENLIEEISVRGGGILQSIRQSDNAKLHEGDLIFVYPMIMDATLDRQWGDILRDFVATVFTNRIKQTNVLNIISDATSPGDVGGPKGQGLNPAQELHRSLGGREPMNPDQPNLFQSDIDAQKKYDYSETLGKFREYIKSQVVNDPAYANLKPMVSEVIAQNLIPVPVIIGTNKQKINSQVLYWILFIAAGQNLPLDNANNLDPIGKLLRQIPSDKYEKFLDGVVDPKAMDTDRQLETLIKGIRDQTEAAAFKFKMVLDLKTWEEELPSLPHVATVSTAVQNKRAAEISLGLRASTAYRTFVSNEVVGLLQSITHSIVPETEIDISTKLSKFIDNSAGSQNISSSYSDLYGLISGQMVSASNSEPTKVDALDNLLDVATTMCKQNAEINVDKIFRDNISTLKFGLTQGGKKFAEFTEKLTLAGAQVSGLSQTLEEFIIELGGTPAASLLSEQKKSFRESIIDYFESGWQDNEALTRQPSSYDPNTRTPNNPTAPEPWVNNPAINHIDPINVSASGLFDSERFKFLTGQIKTGYDGRMIRDRNGFAVIDPDGKANQAEFQKSMYNAVTEILHFLYMFSFFSFFCDYLRELQAEVTVQKRDATSFPNYVLVTKIEYISRIYWALSTRNFKNEMTSEKEKDKLDEFKEKTNHFLFWKRSDQKRVELELDKRVRGIKVLWKQTGVRALLDPVHQDMYDEKKSLDEKVEFIYKAATLDINRSRDNTRISKLEALKTWLEKDTPVVKSEQKGKNLNDFRISSASDTQKQIKLIQDRLRIPNMIVIDEKNKKVYYKLMFMQRMLNLDFGSLKGYIDSQKNILKAF